MVALPPQAHKNHFFNLKNQITSEYYGNYLIGFSDAEFNFIDVFGDGDKLVKHWNFKGTHDGELFGIPATNNKVDINGTTIVLMKDGRILQEQDFFDNYSFLKQLGLLQ